MISASEFSGYNVSSCMSTGLFSAKEVRPANYLAFAEADLAEADSERSRINALGNAKRALHLQIERLTDALGFDRWRGSTLRGFPRRLEFARRCETITPRVLERVNRLRNEVEHDYRVPERHLVEDYVDVVALYLGASDRFVGAFPHDREMYTGPWNENRTMYTLCTEAGSGVLRLYQCDHLTLVRARPESNVPNPSKPAHMRLPEGIDPIRAIDIDADHAEYFDWVKILLRTDQ